jgi:hypothetical protein
MIKATFSIAGMNCRSKDKSTKREIIYTKNRENELFLSIGYAIMSINMGGSYVRLYHSKAPNDSQNHLGMQNKSRAI